MILLEEIFIEDLGVSDKTLKHYKTNQEAYSKVFKAMDRALISGSNRVSPLYLVDKYGHNTILEISYVLSKYELIINEVSRAYAVMVLRLDTINKYVDIDSYRHTTKLSRFKMRKENIVASADIVKTVRGYEKTGIVRKGFAKAAINSFRLDTDTLNKYKDIVIDEILYGINKAITKAKENKSSIYNRYFSDKYNYSKIAEEIVDYYIANPDNEYNLENVVLDSRGRAIYKGLKRIGNPISYKIFRALLVVPTRTITLGKDSKAINSILSFIADLHGEKCIGKTSIYKSASGFRLYTTKTMPKTVDHEYIWLERIYTKLDELYANGTVEWNVPVEIDQTASVMAIIGCLTGDAKLLEKTNLIGNTFSDPWTVEGLSRNHVKAIATPTAYGSSATVKELYKAKGVDFTKEKVKLGRKLMNDGLFSTVKLFKDLFTRTYQPESKDSSDVAIKILDENFIVPINKFKIAGTKISLVSLATDKGTSRYLHKSKLYTVDHDRFRIFFASGLVHNRDSWVLDKTILDADKWCIAIHDAIVCNPADVATFSEAYAQRMYEVYKNREQILLDYRVSIGAISTKASVLYTKMLESAKSEEVKEFNTMCLE